MLNSVKCFLVVHKCHIQGNRCLIGTALLQSTSW